MAPRKKAPKKKQIGWLNKKEMSASCSISTVAFDKWEVMPIAKIGRENFYLVSDVLSARIEHALNSRTYKPTPRQVPDSADHKLDPLNEKTKLDVARRVGQELTNEKSQGEVFPIELAQSVFAKMGAEIAAVLESLPAKIKRVMPKMTATHMNLVRLEIAKARNSAVDVHEKLDEFIEDYYT